MKIAPVFGLIAALALLAGCVGSPAKPITINATFDPNEVVFINADGENTISGQAFLRQSGGSVVTCAGEAVWLIPAGNYAKVRMLNIYGTSVAPARQTGSVVDEPNPRYLDLQRTTSCDAQGDFTFTNVPDGDYFVATTVQWFVGNAAQGGGVMAPVSVSDKQDKRIIIAP